MKQLFLERVHAIVMGGRIGDHAFIAKGSLLKYLLREMGVMAWMDVGVWCNYRGHFFFFFLETGNVVDGGFSVGKEYYSELNTIIKDNVLCEVAIFLPQFVVIAGFYVC